MSKVLPYNAKQWEIPLLLDGRKTVTRRVVKKSQCNGLPKIEPDDWDKECLNDPWCNMPDSEFIKCTYNPPYHTGYLLYVRETWAQVGDIPHWNEYVRTEGNIPVSPLEYVYKVDNMKVDGILPKIKWHPSIHMPKEAARIWLKVTDVRVERLQDITREQARTEGEETLFIYE